MEELPEVPDLGDFTAGDLDALLQIDKPMLTIPPDASTENQNPNQDTVSLSLMDFNRQPLPSQMSASFVPTNNRFRLDNTEDFNNTLPWTDNATEAMEISSLIMCTQDIEQIILNDTTMPNVNEAQIAENARRSQQTRETNKGQASSSSSSVIEMTSGAARSLLHFPVRIKEENNTSENAVEDFELSPLDLDFEELTALERLHSSQTLKNRRGLQTQLPNFKPPRPFSPKHDISISCPPPACRRAPSTSKSNSKLSDVEPVNFLVLEFGSDAKTQNDFDLSMRGEMREQRPQQTTGAIPKERDVSNPQRQAQTHFPAVSPQSSVLHFSDHPQASHLSIHEPAASATSSRQQVNDEDMQDDPLNLSTSYEANVAVAAATTAVSFERMVVNNSTADVTTIPLSVKKLFDVIKTQYSDFAFVYALSAQLCQDRVPMDCFVSLKMGLLLSLASIGSNSACPPLPVVAIGNDSYMINYLMMEVGQLAARFVGPSDDYKPPSTTGYRNFTWIEADPILLAKGGVYYVGDWSCVKTARADKIFKDVECWRVSIERSKNNYPLETAIWTHWRTFKGNAKEQQSFNKFVKIFGIPLHVDDRNHEVLVDYTLKQSSVNIYESTVDYLSISSQDMREYLAVISKRTVDLTPEAMLLLQKYFVAARVSRPDCFTKQAFVSLKQFAESFAKLAFRHEVLTIDVVAAIYLCENFMQNLFGASSNPPPPFESHNFVGLVDGHLSQFHEWLQEFIEHNEGRE